MIEKSFKITNNTGMDAKMSSAIVSVCGRYNSEITLQCAKIQVNLKSIMGVMSLNIHKNEIIKIFISGIDEEEVSKELSYLFNDIKLGKEY